MRSAGLALLAVFAACAASPGDDLSPAARAAAQPWERDAFTRTFEIEIDGRVVGHLVEYQPIPAGVGIERALPTGSYRIQRLDFEDDGFISPRGGFWRLTAAGSESLGWWPLQEGLRVYFGGGQRVRLNALEPVTPKPAAAEPEADSPSDPDEGGAEESGEE